jgi:hypothetical protein
MHRLDDNASIGGLASLSCWPWRGLGNGGSLHAHRTKVPTRNQASVRSFGCATKVYLSVKPPSHRGRRRKQCRQNAFSSCGPSDSVTRTTLYVVPQ